MTLRHIIIAFFAVAISAGMGLYAAPVHATPGVSQSAESAVLLSAASKKKPVKRRSARQSRDGRQIACTVFGCRPIPRHCRPVTGYNLWGVPTGFDDVVCR